MKILIVEDHVLLAQSLASALRAEGADVRVDVSSDAAQILALARASRPGLVLLDLDLGGELGCGFPLIQPLRDLGAHVVMLTGVTDRVRLAECVEAGAIGIVPKSESFDALLDAIREVIEFGSLLTRHQRDELMAELRRQRTERRRRFEPFETLTPREQEVLQALMDGKSADSIAEEWVLSITTIRSQIRAVLQKLRVNSQLSAVALARRSGWPAGRP